MRRAHPKMILSSQIHSIKKKVIRLDFLTSFFDISNCMWQSDFTLASPNFRLGNGIAAIRHSGYLGQK